MKYAIYVLWTLAGYLFVRYGHNHMLGSETLRLIHYTSVVAFCAVTIFLVLKLEGKIEQ